jgi:hypothetical protein
MSASRRKRTNSRRFGYVRFGQLRTHAPRQNDLRHTVIVALSSILMTVDMRDAVLTLPVFGTLGRKRSEPADPE